MQVKKPLPLDAAERKPLRLCVVCGEVSYSVGGIHPQCAQQQADARRVARIKAEQKLAPAPEPALAKSWTKPCPKCGLPMHIRKKLCDCGYHFS